MLLSHAKSQVFNEGSLGKQQATIDINPTIMHVLSRDLYSRPVEAVFRETLTNAIDAHVEAGMSHIPVDIKLPHLGDEEWYIRDYGDGLSEDRINELYLVYGKSTRRDSNEYTGAFGLGCKASLAYTSAFMVTSYHEGMKNEYLIYYDQDNIPCLDHRSSEPSDEPSGLKVSLTMVHPSDYAQFHAAARKILPYVPRGLYTLLDVTHSILEEELHLPEGETYGKMTLRPGKTNLKVVMGYVAYDVDIGAVSSYLQSKNSTSDGYRLLKALVESYDVTINSEIGQYPIHPSREYINITPRSVNALMKDLNEGANELFNSLTSGLSADILHYKLYGTVQTTDFKLRARLITPSRYGYYGNISNLITSYENLVFAILAQSNVDSVSYLPQTDFVDYFSGGRNYTYPSGINKQTILVLDEGTNIENLKEIFANYNEVDLTPFVEGVRREVVQQTAIARSRNAPVRSLQDVSHNIMFLKTGRGDQKKCWESAKHNVASLQELKKMIFWVPTKMGCVKDPDALAILDRFATIKGIIPGWKQPIIIGLPATKGTTQIERTFQPINALSTWMDNFIESDYFKRRNYFYRAQSIIRDKLKADCLENYREYGPADLLYRIVQRGKKYAGPSMVHANPEGSGHEVHLEEYVKHVVERFNYLSNCFWYDELVGNLTWAKELAELANNKPTSAIYKNRGY